MIHSDEIKRQYDEEEDEHKRKAASLAKEYIEAQAKAEKLQNDLREEQETMTDLEPKIRDECEYLKGLVKLHVDDKQYYLNVEGKVIVEMVEEIEIIEIKIN